MCEPQRTGGHRAPLPSGAKLCFARDVSLVQKHLLAFLNLCVYSDYDQYWVLWRRKGWGCSRPGEVSGEAGMKERGCRAGEQPQGRPGDWSHETCSIDGKVTSQGLQLSLKRSNHMGPCCQTALKCPAALLPHCHSCTALPDYPSCHPCLPCSRPALVLPWISSKVLQLHQLWSLSTGLSWLWGWQSSLLSSFHSNKGEESEGRCALEMPSRQLSPRAHKQKMFTFD